MRCYEAVKLFRDRIAPWLGADALQDVCIYIYKLWRGGVFVIRIASSFFISSTGSLCIFFHFFTYCSPSFPRFLDCVDLIGIFLAITMPFSNVFKWAVPLLLVNEVAATKLVPIRPHAGRQGRRQEPSGFDLKSDETFLWGSPGRLSIFTPPE